MFRPYNLLFSLTLVLFLAILMSACGMQAKVGSAGPITAATDYVSALADRDYDRTRGLRDPAQAKQIAFDNNYFDDERARIGISNANPQFSELQLRDANGQVTNSDKPITTSSATVQLQIVGGPKLRLVAINNNQVWYISDIQKQLELGVGDNLIVHAVAVNRRAPKEEVQ